MEITFYQLPKRPNSTKTVDKTNCPWFTVNAELKDPCSIANPAFILHLTPGRFWPSNVTDKSASAPANITNYTHADIGEINAPCRIYYIENIEIDNTTATVHLLPDLLASFRDTILNSSQFVSRISNALRVTHNQIDPLPVALTGKTFTYKNSYTDVFRTGFETGSYVLGVINNNPTVGNVCYYLFQTGAALTQLMSYLMDNVEWANISDISEELAKSLINPMQYIVSCKYFPLDIDYYTANNSPLYETVKIGYWETPVQAYKMLDYSTTINGSIELDRHPQARSAVDYLTTAPYTERVFYLEPFGAIPIDPGNVNGPCTELAYQVEVDHISGMGKLYLRRELSTNDYLSVTYAKVAHDIQLAQLTTNVAGVVESVVGGAAGVIGNIANLNFGGAVESAARGVIDAFTNAMPQVRTSSGNSCIPFVGGRAVLYSRFTEVQTAFNDEFGYPFNSVVNLSSCSGDWVQCPHPRLELKTSSANAQQIYSVMRGGVYLE